MTEPAANNRIEGANASRRPKRSDNVAMKGCNTAWDKRYAVPVQNVCVDVPWSSTANVGSTGTSIVASKATTRELSAQVIMIHSSFVVGFHFDFSVSCSEYELDGDDRTEIPASLRSFRNNF